MKFRSVESAKIGAATASTEAKWRGVVEKLVGALDAYEQEDGCGCCQSGANYEAVQNFQEIRKQAITEAAQMLGRHKVYQCTVCGCDLLDGRGKFLGDRQCDKHLPPV